MEQGALQQIEADKWEQWWAGLEQEMSDQECRLAQGKEQMRTQFKQFAAGRCQRKILAHFRGKTNSKLHNKHRK